MVIFNSYVSLPEGRILYLRPIFLYEWFSPAVSSGGKMMGLEYVAWPLIGVRIHWCEPPSIFHVKS